MFFADAHALLNNDFTRANSTFSKRRFEESKMSSMQGKKARESGKMLERKLYENTGDVSYLREEKPHFEEGLPGAEMSKQRAFDNKKDFVTPEYHGKTKSDLWSGADVPLAMENTDRNLSKKYLGKIDVNKRDSKYQEYLRDQYSELMEMSMREINKFYFRESHSADPGIPITTAGGALRDNEESFWDFLSPNKKIGRGRVFVRKLKFDSSGNIVDSDAPDSPPTISKPAASPASPTAAPRTTSSAPNKNVPPQRYRGELRSMEKVDDNIGRQFDILNVPEEMRSGSPTIRVEVKDSDF